MRKIVTFTIATLLTASALGAGDVYRWKADDGTWHYSDQPRAGAELVRSSQHRSLPMTDAAGSPATRSAPAAPTATTDGGPVSSTVAQQVRDEAAAAKAEQCKKAEAAYQSAIQARRIYKTDAQGNQVFMDESQMDAARLQARANRDLACGTGT